MRPKLLAAALLVAATVAVFCPVVGHDFVNWDDDRNVYENPQLQPVTPAQVARFWSAPSFHVYMPVTQTTWAALAWLSPATPDAGFDPRLFHAANVVLHTVDVLLVWAILQAIGMAAGAAVAGALLFALHPVQVEPVAWVTGLKDVLAGFWALVAIWQYVRFTSAGGAARRHYAIASVAYGLAVLAKPTALSAVFVVAWLEVVLLRGTPKRVAMALAPWLCVAAAVTLVNAAYQPAPHFTAAAWTRPWLALDALGFYLAQIAWPRQLGMDYGRTPAAVLASPWLRLAPWLALAVGAAVWRWRRRGRWPLVASGIGVAALLPVLGLVPFGYQDVSTVADRYLYLALLGPAVGFAALWTAAAPRRWALCGCAAFVVCLAVQSVQQQRHWRTARDLFEHGLAINPQSRVARFNLGSCLARTGHYAAATGHFEFLLRQDPGDSEAENLLGMTRVAAGDVAGGIAHYRQVIRLHPEDATAHFNLAAALVARGELDAAAREYRAVLRLHPDDVAAHYDVGNVLAAQGNLEEASVHFAAAVRLDSGFEPARAGLGRAQAELRRQRRP